MEKQLEMDIPDDGDDPPERIVTVTADSEIDGVDIDWLEIQSTTVLLFLGKTQSKVTVRVVDDITMSQLHEKHSNDRTTTDVLTFDNGSNELAIDADIAICSEVASRATCDQSHTLNEELLLYIVHGILHCVGFDDHDEESHLEMHEEEDRILTAIGVGPVWSRGA
ncbi:MAG: rRNA maturation RNase YbeY [Planctomycetota bacterium]|nr:rRNA maturation RNase YbeY [Planctomycetota bacterium]